MPKTLNPLLHLFSILFGAIHLVEKEVKCDLVPFIKLVVVAGQVFLVNAQLSLVEILVHQDFELDKLKCVKASL